MRAVCWTSSTASVAVMGCSSFAGQTGSVTSACSFVTASDVMASHEHKQGEDRDGREPRRLARDGAGGADDVADGCGDLGEDGLEHVGLLRAMAAVSAINGLGLLHSDLLWIWAAWRRFVAA